MKNAYRITAFVIGGSIFCALVGWQYLAYRADARLLTIAFLDVGQGDAIYVRAPGGGDMLIDGGPDRGMLRSLAEVMPFFDRTVNVILVSNPDKDHIAGFIPLLERYGIGAVVEPGTIGASGVYEALKQKGDTHATRIVARRGTVIDLGGGAHFEVLFPDRDVSGVTTNTGSIVGRLIYGDTSVMFPGDAPDEIEQYVLVLDGEKVNSDILKAGHHGSRTSSVPEFVAAVSPQTAVISSGSNNSYGHPHKETLDTFQEADIEVLNTADQGTIIFKSDGKTIWRVR
ncbi:MAG: hypothetical protein A2408_01400 [Candidatus Yonathbacteria bacterium RIFOXYC1_FULL_52_10]|uniref:Metallo-beta-lactamase domain-containing protein n=1 Tax=Candidatus Yonathbacteria bacterium RIFOXYD1_FULL_52_36 TaxID=1802730 RepID=A0A1G2SIM2_9BACT|nr:MAG: hypothetical protein A2591_01045 [Candidatus Yonathbacteria bacterium RIFOXYD1_FULL_52_36]OHA85545.1 MAG: hypothetical protein A2408_01400 [Candidatus Yonathbacteria bacterium RIFOXYC1_FULL_52_10]